MCNNYFHSLRYFDMNGYLENQYEEIEFTQWTVLHSSLFLCILMGHKTQDIRICNRNYRDHWEEPCLLLEQQLLHVVFVGWWRVRSDERWSKIFGIIPQSIDQSKERVCKLPYCISERETVESSISWQSSFTTSVKEL
jgi:hypothetical protein